GGAPNGFHFQTQLSNRSIIVEEYYNQNNSGFGAYIKLRAPGTSYFGPYLGTEDKITGLFESAFPGDKYSLFGPADMNASRGWRYGRHDNGTPRYYRMPFMPVGSVSFTPFTHGFEGPADHSIRGDKN